MYLRDDAGLITTFVYASATTAGETTAGDAAGYLQSSSVQRGERGTPVLQGTMQYFVHSGGGATVVPLASSTVYRSQASGTDAGFELPHQGIGTSAYAYAPSGSAWTFSASSGVAGNGSGFTSGNPDAPQGTQVGFLQDAGSSISQAFFFDAGTYTIHFDAAQRQNYQPAGAQTIEVRVDGNLVGTFTPGSSYTLQTTGSFTVTAGNHTIAFLGLTSGDSTAFIDDVKVAAVSGAQTTSFAYTFFADSTRMQSMTTSLPVVSAAQNGPGVADVSDVILDEDGRTRWTRNAQGFLNYFAYDEATGALVTMIVDVDTTQTGDFEDLPSGWSTPSGGGLHLISTMEVDDLGRTVMFTNPGGHVTFTVYNDAAHEVRTYRGWDFTTNRRPARPKSIAKTGRAAIPSP
ncbi:MAG: hypothetical protein K2R98_22585 [Gemmataceae bacterium]|nr:hypothetical protein [Gemmataceae bacterium]